MDPPPQPPSSSSTDTPPSQDPPPPQPQPQPPPSQPPPSSTPSPNPNPNPNPNPTTSLATAPQFNRPWPHTTPFPHYPSQFQPQTPSSSAPSPSSSVPRGGIALGVPATPASAVSSQPASFSPAFVGAQFAGITRAPGIVSDSVAPASNPSAVRPATHAIPSMGTTGSQIRHGGVPPSVLSQQRPAQSALNNIPPVPQNFAHGMLRASSVASPSSSAPSTSQSQQAQHQPWLSSVTHGRTPLSSQPPRPIGTSQSLQQRSHVPHQPPQPTTATSQPQQQQQQSFAPSNQSQQNLVQQLSSSRVSHPSVNQQQTARLQGLGNQRPPSPAIVQPNMVQPSPISMPGTVEATEPCTKILSKRSIQELVNQLDPSERLDPEVEDVLVDIAEDFIDSVTTFGCSLAKHRKSNTLEAKDILLHLERNWDMIIPGFSGDEIRTFKKPVISDAHKERLAVIKRSLSAADVKTSGGPATGNIKGPLSKANPNVVGS